jgi:hypothetical protein
MDPLESTLPFKVFHQQKTWAEANQFCEGWGGHLASIHSETENHIVYSLLGQPVEDEWRESERNDFADKYWLGFHDANAEMDFSWTDGSCANYTNWAPNEPNQWEGTTENCVSFWNSDEQWNDWQCD